jgi:hypothetical protein
VYVQRFVSLDRTALPDGTHQSALAFFGVGNVYILEIDVDVTTNGWCDDTHRPMCNCRNLQNVNVRVLPEIPLQVALPSSLKSCELIDADDVAQAASGAFCCTSPADIGAGVCSANVQKHLAKAACTDCCRNNYRNSREVGIDCGGSCTGTCSCDGASICSTGSCAPQCSVSLMRAVHQL